MARIPVATRESVPEDQRDAFDQMLEEYGAVPGYGPLSVIIQVPEAWRRAIQLHRYLRNESVLPLKIRELAMLLAGREFDCQHIWTGHAQDGRSAGLRDEIVTALRDESELTGLSPDEAAVVNYGREFFRTHRVSQSAYEAALEQFGLRGLVELTMLMGWYCMLAFTVNAFDTDLKPDSTEPLLPV